MKYFLYVMFVWYSKHEFYSNYVTAEKSLQTFKYKAKTNLTAEFITKTQIKLKIKPTWILSKSQN